MDKHQQNSTEAPRVGIDFGAGALVIVTTAPGGEGYRALTLPGITQDITALTGSVPVVPSLLCYNDSGSVIVGDDVIRAGLAGDPTTARWIRNYVLDGSAVRIPAGSGNLALYRTVAADFLTTILLRVAKESGDRPEAVFSIPAGAPEWYPGWLAGIGRSAGFTACLTISEHAAAITGYGLPVTGTQVIIVLRLDESGLSIAVVRFVEEEMHILGEACDITGTRELDRWIVRDIVTRVRIQCTVVKTQQLTSALLVRIGEVHMQLAKGKPAVLEISDPVSRSVLSACISQEDLCRILAENGFKGILDRVASRALALSRSRGLGDETPAAVILLGRGCILPAVQDCIQERFRDIRVLADHPIDALARGAAGSPPIRRRIDRIENDYALRYWDEASREHRYRFLVHSGTRYPSAGQVARITISAAYDGQTRLGIPLYEMNSSGSGTPVLELVSDPGGGVRVAMPVDDAGQERRPLPVTGRTPTLLTAEPPALKGEPRFELTFRLDCEKQLCVTARDLLNGMLVKKDVPIHRLT